MIYYMSTHAVMDIMQTIRANCDIRMKLSQGPI